MHSITHGNTINLNVSTKKAAVNTICCAVPKRVIFVLVHLATKARISNLVGTREHRLCIEWMAPDWFWGTRFSFIGNPCLMGVLFVPGREW
mmetsp:Transcript_22791/g.48436  ORF Transcript_22791/g.48436 Transcript_22791/m.48436 type:complete len:91 (-) Transcript_22791:1250-1522(-)